MTIDDVTSPSIPQPAIAEVAKATVADINATGGVAGHPIDLTVCDGQGDPNQTAKCARKAVSDKVVAVVGAYSGTPTSLLPILTSAKIPYIPNYAFAPQEFSAPNSYAITAGFTQLAGQGLIAGKYCSSAVIVAADYPGIDFNTNLINLGFKQAGKPTASVVKIPLTPGDFSSQATQIVSTKAQCVIEILSVGQELALYPALKSAGSTQRIVGAAGTLTADVVGKTSAVLENALIVDSFAPYDDAKFSAYRAITAKYSDPKKYDFSNSGARAVYVDFLAFKQIAQATLAAKQDVTAESVTGTLNKTTALDTGGLIPVLDLTQPAPIKGFPQLFGRSVTFEVVKGGKIVSLDNDKFHDTTTALQAALGK